MYPHLQERELEQRVRLHLTATRRELAGIRVRAQGGVVRLSGHVPSFYLRQIALAAARHVAGVQSVCDAIEVPICSEVEPLLEPQLSV